MTHVLHCAKCGAPPVPSLDAQSDGSLLCRKCATETATPEQFCYPAPKVCHEHWSGYGEDGSLDCCICSANPCDSVTVAMAIEHGGYQHWRGRLDGVFLARSVLSDAIGAAAPVDRPLDAPDAAFDAAVEAFHAAWVIVRGSIDEPPF